MPDDLVAFSDVLKGYANTLIEVLPSIGIAIVVFLFFWFASKFGRSVAISASDSAVGDESLKSLFGTITRVAILVLGIFTSASILFPGLGAGDLVAVLGLSSVAIGFAFKDIFQNFLAGILILIQRPFHIGDQIVVSGYEGTVEAIDIRSTLIKTHDSQRVIMPNSEIYSSPVKVKTAFEQRRTTFGTGIGYDEDIEAGREVIESALEECELVLEDPAPQVYVSGHGDSSVDFDVRYWTDSEQADVTKAKNEVATRVRYALEEADIEIPYPYRTVEFFDMTEESEGGEEQAA